MCAFINVNRPFQANSGWRGASSHGLSLNLLIVISATGPRSKTRKGVILSISLKKCCVCFQFQVIKKMSYH